MIRKLVLLIILMFVLAYMSGVAFRIQRVEAGGIIYIRADGSIEGTTDISTVDNVTYTFTDNIFNQSVVVEKDNIVVDGAGYTLQGTGNGTGITLVGRSDLTIKNTRIKGFKYGIGLSGSSNTIISRNRITSNSDGIDLVGSSNNTISGNNMTNNGNGIMFWWSSNNSVSENNITTNSHLGIFFASCSNNSIFRNNIVTNNMAGIEFIESSNNTISENNIMNNLCGIGIFDSLDNTIYYNNFINNSIHESIAGSRCIWDKGYPVGGNYWSNYDGIDVYNGSFQNEPGSDGIGDAPYIINENNQDKYPLIHPYGSIRNLDTNLTYLTIQSAIDAPETQDGHTILVEAGSYYEHVVIVKSISLVGKDKHNTIIDGNGTGTVVDIIADNVYINGFTIQKSGGAILNPKFGIYMTSSGNNISFNRVMNNLYGVCLDYSYFNTVSGNNLTNNEWYGVFLYQSSNNTVSQNDMTNNDHGTELYNSSNNTISGNRIVNNVCNGINLWNSSSNTILENDITNNVCGITLHDSSGNSICRNNITSNKAYGINLGELSSNNLFYNNDFVNNTKQVSKGLGSTNHWDNGYLCGGNYWSDFTDVDQYSGQYQNETGSDGIWDTPYVIDENNQDNYPIVPEFPSFIILPLFMMATLLVVIIYRRKHSM